MSSKSPPADQSQEERVRAARDADLVLRDESDEIIDNLKQQLSTLQKELERFQGGADAAGATERAGLEAGLAPHIASRLQMPADELSGRLERLLERIDDPALKAELEACRDTAFFLSDTFRGITDNHDALTATLTADRLELRAEDFCERLQAALRERDLATRVEPVSPLPEQLTLSPQSAITVLMTLAELAADLFGQPERLTVACPACEGMAPGTETHLQLQITGSHAWGDVGDGEAVSSVAIRSGARSRAVVDLLYVEKIMEMRGGWLEFYRREGQVYGFTVAVPVTLLGPRTA